MRGLAAVVAIGVAAFGAGASQAGALAPGETVNLLSAPGTFTPLPATAGFSGLGDLTARAVSDNGRYVVFTSEANVILPGTDDDATAHVYRRDTDTGQTVLISRATGLGGAPGDDFSSGPTISGNGDRVAFTTRARLDPADTDDQPDVYVRLVTAGVTRLVSRAAGAGGADGNGRSESAEISGNGQFVVFESTAGNLLGGGAPTFNPSIYRRNLADDSVALISVGAASAEDPAVDDAGSRVAFVTGSPVAVGDLDSDDDVYLRDVGAGTTTHISVANDESNTSGDASEPSVSANGALVAFTSRSANLDQSGVDTDSFQDVYVRNPLGGTTLLVSRDGVGGDDCEGTCWRPLISNAAGQDRVTFLALNSPAIGGTTAQVAIQRSINGAAFQDIVSRGPGVGGTLLLTQGIGVARLGTDVAFASSDPFASATDSNDFGTVLIRRPASGTTTEISVPPSPMDLTRSLTSSEVADSGGGPAITPDGRYVAFSSTSDALLPGTGDPGFVPEQAFRRDLLTGETVLVSRGNASDAPADGAVDRGPAISADGRYVAFVSRSPALAAEFGATAPVQVYRRDVVSGVTTLVSLSDGDAPAADGVDAAESPSVSADGNRIAFAAFSPGLAPGQTTAVTHIFVRDIAAGTTTLVSRHAAGAAFSGGSAAPYISASGTAVAFETETDDLDGAAGADPAQVVVRDLAANTTTVASRAPGGALANFQARTPSISADGTRVAFQSNATNLDPADTDTASSVYLATLPTAGISLVSRLDGETGSSDPGIAADAHISPDGRYVLFTSTSALEAADTNANDDGYLRDTLLNTTRRVTLGAGGVQLTEADGVGLSQNAACVLMQTRDGAIQPGSPVSQDFTLIGVRALSTGCAEPASVTPPPGTAPAPGPVADTTAPGLTNVSLTRKRFRVAGLRVRALPGRRLAPAGSVLRLRLSEPARVRLLFERRAKGKRVNRRCLAPTRARAKRPNCVRFIRAGVLTRPTLAAGARRIAITGKIGRRALRPGAYRLSVTAFDAAGNRSVVRRVNFTIVRR